ncbi:hypothetical protein NDU88_001515 [Pleurodeles waltl]|uniref:Uncharacterized protein n=1 Tax=Pleurodeles waltl TaxID=8319 RepID=A0AAV7M5J6_PLEWA|nr:hypothetical protein NDU88_001515 [Pleurodeles waltl]
MAVRGSESPWRRSKLRRHGGFPWAAESRRYTAGFPLLAAAVPPRSECPAEHRQPVGGATADPGPGVFYHRGQNDPLSVDVRITALKCTSHVIIVSQPPTRCAVQELNAKHRMRCWRAQ